jgi:hypothetical protein
MIDALVVGLLLAARPRDAQWYLDVVKSQGARSVIDETFDDPVQWSQISEGIETGDAAWLDVAEALGRVSDAGATYSLSLSLGKALARRPTEVLTRLAAGRLPGIFSPEGVCGQYDVDSNDNSLEAGLSFLIAQGKAVRAVTTPALQLLKKRCLREIQRAPDHLRRFYGRSKGEGRRNRNFK